MKFTASPAPNLFVSPVALPKHIVFRLVQWADLYALHDACFPAEAFGDFAARFESSVRLQEAGRLLHVVACHELERRIVGSGQLVGYTGATAEIADLAIADAMRNQGLGTALVRVLGALAAAAGASRLEIAVDVDNTRALSLYRRLGFRAWRILRMPRGGRAVLLVRAPWSAPTAEERDNERENQ